MIQSFETSSRASSPTDAAPCSLIARSQYAEAVVQAAYASRGRRPLRIFRRWGRMIRAITARGRGFSDGLRGDGPREGLRQGLGQELGQGVGQGVGDGLVETLVTLIATILFGLSWASIELRSADAETIDSPIGVGAETGYAGMSVATASFPFNGVSNTQWTDEPHARSKR